MWEPQKYFVLLNTLASSPAVVNLLVWKRLKTKALENSIKSTHSSRCLFPVHVWMDICLSCFHQSYLGPLMADSLQWNDFELSHKPKSAQVLLYPWKMTRFLIFLPRLRLLAQLNQPELLSRTDRPSVYSQRSLEELHLEHELESQVWCWRAAISSGCPRAAGWWCRCALMEYGGEIFS